LVDLDLISRSLQVIHLGSRRVWLVNAIQKKLLGGFQSNLAVMFYGLCSPPDYLLVDLDLITWSLKVIDLISRYTQ
jgi:hypothetical protein